MEPRQEGSGRFGFALVATFAYNALEFAKHARQNQICGKFGFAHGFRHAIDLRIGFADNV